MTGLIDSHTHIIPPDLPDLTAEFPGVAWPSVDTSTSPAEMRFGSQLFRKLDSRAWDLQARLADMDRLGVARQVLSPIPATMMHHTDSPGVLALSRFQNEWLAAAVADHPDRFWGLGTVPIQCPDLAAGMVRECVRELGLSGVEISTSIPGLTLGDPRLEPFYNACVEVDATLFVHPDRTLSGDRLAALGMNSSIGVATETAIAASEIILAGVFDRFPKIKILLAHGGGSLCSLHPRIARCASFVNPDDAVAAAFSEQVGNFYLDSLVYGSPQLASVVSMVGESHVLLGTDYPFPLGEQVPGQLILQSELPPDTQAALLYANAARLFGLRPR